MDWEIPTKATEEENNLFEQRFTLYKENDKNKQGGIQMTYKEVNPEYWTPTEEGDFIEGKLVQKQENVGANDSMLYSIETLEGVENVWGSAILDQRMQLVKVGSQVRITYKGLGVAKGGHNAPKIFKVEVDQEDVVETVKV